MYSISVQFNDEQVYIHFKTLKTGLQLVKLLKSNGVSGSCMADSEILEQRKKAQEISQYEVQRKLIIDMELCQHDYTVKRQNNMNMIILSQNNSENQSKTFSPIPYKDGHEKLKFPPYSILQSPKSENTLQNSSGVFTWTDNQEMLSSLMKTNQLQQTISDINKSNANIQNNSQLSQSCQQHQNLQINQVQVQQPICVQSNIYPVIGSQLIHYENTRNDNLMFNHMKFNVKGQADNQLNLDECGLTRYAINKYNQQVDDYISQLPMRKQLLQQDNQPPEDLNIVVQNFLAHNSQRAMHNNLFWVQNNKKLLTEVANQLQAFQIQNIVIPTPPVFLSHTQFNPQQINLAQSKIKPDQHTEYINNIKIPQGPIQPFVQKQSTQRKSEQSLDRQPNETQTYSSQLQGFYDKIHRPSFENQAQIYEILNQISAQISIQDIYTMVLLCMQSYLQSEPKTIANIFSSIEYIIKRSFNNKNFQFSQQLMLIISFIIDDMKNILDKKAFQHTFKQVDFHIFQKFYQSNEQYKFTQPEVKLLFQYANDKLISQLQCELCPKQILHKI